jgi:transposase
MNKISGGAKMSSNDILTYFDLVRQMKNPFDLRLKMVMYAKKYGNKPCARVFSTTVKTVRKWRRRYEEKGLSGLKEESRAPHNIPHKTSLEIEKKVVNLRTRLKTWGAERLKRDFDIPCSHKAIQRIYKAYNLTKSRKKKHKTKNDLRKVKSQWRAFQQIGTDTKVLDDIPNYWSQMKNLDLPKVQYTARDVRAGIQFLGYAKEMSLAHSIVFVEYVNQHLESCGVNLRKVKWQSDNGPEYGLTCNTKNPSEFTLVLEEVYGCEHGRIPPAAHTYNSDTETVHRLIEDEFFDLETFDSKESFWSKVTTYNLFFNEPRKNSYKDDKTPLEILKEIAPHINPNVTRLPPVDLDELPAQKISTCSNFSSFKSMSQFYEKGGYHVGWFP